jgi:hypothetical protein
MRFERTKMPPIRPLLLGLAVLAAGCAATSLQPTIFDRAAVHHPEALFDVASRSAQLRQVSAGTGQRQGERICMRASDIPDYGPLLGPSLGAVKGGGETNNAARDMARALNASAFYILYQNDETRARADVAVLRRHAEANAWIVANPSWTNAAGAINAMSALLPAWHILRQTDVPTPEDRAAIEAWLRRLAQQADVHPGDNNLGAARGASDMMLGLMLGDQSRYRKGVATGFMAQLAAMRPDGSFPAETDRGRGALQNQSQNIASLVYAAEIAASQGENLYGARVDGKGIDDAIRFLLAAVDDNGLIDPYAAANRNPPRTAPDFASNSQLDPFGSAARGWALLYTQRYPRADLSEDIRAHLTIGRRLSSDAVGGNVTCYARRL